MSGAVVKDTAVRKRGLFTGRVENLVIQDGILFHNKDIVHKADFSTQRELPPQLIIAIPLESKALMTYGATHRLRGCRFHKSDPIVATAILYTEPDIVQGAAKANIRSRSIVLSLSLPWLEQQMAGKHRGSFERIFSHHLSRFDWSLPPHLGQIAEALNLTSSQNTPEMLMREAFALTVWESLMVNIQQIAFVCGQRHNEQPTRLKMLLMDEKVDEMALADIADELGMSVSTLQRAAKKELGISLQRYLRERKLQEAKVRLEERSMSLQEAAEHAGYNHAANFITAFRKLFGFSPRQIIRQGAATTEA
ncbi:helix-turn-helix transcriptional regulator [Aeromonas eucrenophila]|uniref:Helix-turn-helix transcriptional regulator n=1 Tax=Aeromonas eucrenophila TaxID=649 RepID=A0ABW0YD75_9GAMM|nr:AraC family transcriptional regulator [Aeromonas eucrenophila]